MCWCSVNPHLKQMILTKIITNFPARDWRCASPVQPSWLGVNHASLWSLQSTSDPHDRHPASSRHRHKKVLWWYINVYFCTKYRLHDFSCSTKTGIRIQQHAVSTADWFTEWLSRKTLTTVEPLGKDRTTSSPRQIHHQQLQTMHNIAQLTSWLATNDL